MRLNLNYLVNSYLVNSYLVYSYLFNSYLVNSYLVYSYLVNSYLFNSYLVNSYLVNSYLFNSYSLTPTSLTLTLLTPTSLTLTSLTLTSLILASLTLTSLILTSLTPTSLSFLGMLTAGRKQFNLTKSNQRVRAGEGKATRQNSAAEVTRPMFTFSKCLPWFYFFLLILLKTGCYVSAGDESVYFLFTVWGYFLSVCVVVLNQFSFSR